MVLRCRKKDCALPMKGKRRSPTSPKKKGGPQKGEMPKPATGKKVRIAFRFPWEKRNEFGCTGGRKGGSATTARSVAPMGEKDLCSCGPKEKKSPSWARQGEQ